jgi:uncharacterized MAPEG superfamily protein
MTTELYWLALTLLITGLFWLPYILDRISVRGLIPAITGTEAETTDDQSLWAKRAIAAHKNAIENLAIFAPAVLILHAIDVSTPTTQLAAAVYFFTRLAHFLIYTFGIPVLRTITFAVGWLAQMAILFTALGWLS